MDGPFEIKIAPGKPGWVHLNFAHRGVIKHSATAPLDLLIRDAISAADKLMGICAGHGWSDSADCSRLATNLALAIKSLPV